MRIFFFLISCPSSYFCCCTHQRWRRSCTDGCSGTVHEISSSFFTCGLGRVEYIVLASMAFSDALFFSFLPRIFRAALGPYAWVRTVWNLITDEFGALPVPLKLPSNNVWSNLYRPSSSCLISFKKLSPS